MKTLRESLQDRILLLDGAMGSLIQTYGLKEEDFQGKLELAEGTRVQGNNDLLNLTRPDIISDIHRRYLEAGADIVTANTFNSQRISQAEYHCGHLVRQLNAEAVRLARQQAKTFSTADKPRYVIYVMLDEPTTTSYGGAIAAPVFQKVATRALAYSGYLPEVNFDLVSKPEPQPERKLTPAQLAQKKKDEIYLANLARYRAEKAKKEQEKEGPAVIIPPFAPLFSITLLKGQFSAYSRRAARCSSTTT